MESAQARQLMLSSLAGHTLVSPTVQPFQAQVSKLPLWLRSNPLADHRLFSSHTRMISGRHQVLSALSRAGAALMCSGMAPRGRVVSRVN